MEEAEITKVITNVIKKLVPVIKDLLNNSEEIPTSSDDELTIATVLREYPHASKYLVRKWCNQGLLDCWNASDESNSKYIFKRGDFEKVYYNQCRAKR